MQAISRNIQLIVMPQGMSKRTLNTTQYRPKTDLILWRLHVVFVINDSYEPCNLLKPESQSSQNNNIGEQSSSASVISVTGGWVWCVMMLLTALISTSLHIMNDKLQIFFSVCVGICYDILF